MSYPRIAARLYDTPLLLAPSVAEAVADALATRMGVEPIGDLAPPRRARRAPLGKMFFGGTSEGDQGLAYEVSNGVAIIPVIGELVNRGSNLDAMSGLTSYSGLRDALAHAADNPEVGGIVLDLDSGGGEATGAMETAAFVRSINARKPVTAHVDGMAASAAYAIASGAGRIISTPSSVLGSIGVVTVHVDRSAAVAKKGLKATIITSGAHKADHSSLAPLSSGARARIQSMSDAIYTLFAQTVATHRKMTIAQVKGTEAGVFLGQQSVRLGLANSIGTLADAMTSVRRPGLRTFAPAGGAYERFAAALAAAPAVAPASHPAIDAWLAMQAVPTVAVAIPGAPMLTPTHDRMTAVSSLPEAAGREALATHLATATTLPLVQCAAILRAALMESPQDRAKAEFESGRAAALELRGIRPTAAAPSEGLRVVGGSAMTPTDGDKFEQGRRAAMELRGLN